ncbi:MAG: 1-deoxy-D-xylulose-5-phosphate reductoisomerase [Proteobacteria bacterium]|nr:1-deoxy-D-xylulose-5-phosphate reductoisomerase [Pseudomonadota bacterium]
MVKSITICGSTGSIGKSTIDVISNSPDSYKVVALTANKEVGSLIKQARILQPNYAVIADEKLYEQLKEGLADLKSVEVMAGFEAINQVASIKCDIFISAIVGMAALMPTVNAIRTGSNIGLANKECLVSAGDVILEEANKYGVKLIPIDSEHNAIFQIFENDHLQFIDNITLTASGGPFFKSSIEEMRHITKEQAVKHPKWSMGAKISVDSATMMNKGLEMIEAYRLFPIEKSQINVVIHPQSIIHGLVDYKDGSTLAMMSIPDMKVPISYAIAYPRRIEIAHEKLNLAKVGKLEFFEPDEQKFPALKLAKQVLETGGNAPTIFNAANEIAVDRFLKGQIAFSDITKIVVEVLESLPYSPASSLDEVIECDQKSRIHSQNLKL